MKVLYNIAGTRHSGGMERILSSKANWLASHGYEVVVVTTDQCGEESFFPMDPRIRRIDLDINYEENNGKSLLNKIIHYPFKQFKHRAALSKILKEENPDVSISMFCNDASFLWKIHDGGKKVLEIHFCRFKRRQYARTGMWGLVDKIRSRQEERLVRKYDRFVVLTDEDKGYWGEMDNILTIPNSRSFKPDVVSELNEKKVIAVGRYTFQKGFDLLIDAWRAVHEACPEWKLDIVGEGEDRELLQRRIDGYGLGDSVTLTGVRHDLDKTYREASLLVMSSRYEGFGLVITEAFSYGLPVVSFECKCGPKDIITDGKDGYLVNPGDIDGLSDRIIRVLKDEDLRKSMGAHALMSSRRYDVDTVMSQWDALFRSL